MLFEDVEGIYKNVTEYYGKVLQNTKDLKTEACICSSSPPQEIKKILKE